MMAIAVPEQRRARRPEPRECQKVVHVIKIMGDGGILDVLSGKRAFLSTVYLLLTL